MSRFVRDSVAGQITRWVLLALVTVVLMIAVWEVRTTLLLVLASIILVVLFTMPIRFLMRRGVGRMPATIMSILVILGVLVLLAMLALPSLMQQFTVLAQLVQDGIAKVVDQWEAVQQDPTLKEQYPLIANLQDFVRNTFQLDNLEELFAELARQLGGALGQLGGSVLPVVGGVASTLLSIIIVIFLSLYLLTDAQVYEEGVIRLFPIGYRGRVRFIIDRIDFNLRLWLQGQLLLMLIVGVASGVGMAVLGLAPAIALGVLAGVFSFVPNFGPLAALVPSLAVGFAQAPDKIFWIVLIIYGTSFLQSQIIAPLIFKESINLPPVLVLVGQIFAAVFFGFLGIMLAVPLISILVIIVQEVYVKDVLGDRSGLALSLPVEEGLVPDEV
ncbi:MAG: AI-2E family transporter [Chloroflexi bacterium]|nr:AI-2E family transporter [Chloroflexota bacterium]MDL1883836.1 AI-2E family transporter [Anaerolineae bacterium CFX8]